MTIKFSGNIAKTDHPELTRLFGRAVPVEAVELIFTAPGHFTLGEIRSQIEAMAAAWNAAGFQLSRIERASESIQASISIAKERLKEADNAQRVHLMNDFADAANEIEATDQDLLHLRGEEC